MPSRTFSGSLHIREKCIETNKILNFSNEVNELMKHSGQEEELNREGKYGE